MEYLITSGVEYFDCFFFLVSFEIFGYVVVINCLVNMFSLSSFSHLSNVHKYFSLTQLT